MNTVIIIPARKGSTRFPNKPMALVLGKKILFRTWRIAKAIKNADGVFVATDDLEIKEQAEKFGAQVVLTSPDCENGTLRVYEALETLSFRPKVVVNFQGDAILTPPWVIQTLIDEMHRDASIALATPATQLDWKNYDRFLQSKAQGRISGTLVVFDQKHNALYFTKGLIPHIQDRSLKIPPIFRHIGLYSYRYDTLKKYSTLSPTPLEKVEKLEQLRALENGIPIRIVVVDYQGRTHWSIDNPEDITVAEEIIQREGELVL